MKQKIGTAVEGEIFRQAKERAAREGLTMSAVIQEALEAYASGRPAGADLAGRRAAHKAFLERPYRLSPKQWKTVMEDDPWRS